ncbi:MAG: competence/damage-inducible protein A [Candidatus Thiodiazotropha sp. (ex Monitilora ramsayi)]|nr:competence/damage-inducible protein A [Candidatus Thiodiazotropha sp. (ex Monitilora ramsayi)]
MSGGEFGLIVIGDEILFGSREDQHQAHFRILLNSQGLSLSRFWLLPDDKGILTSHLRFSMQSALPTFVCGGIGATPDDLTRACAAEAADRPLVRHMEAAALIEARFGEAAYPTRIRMADLPAHCELIPNPHNQIPGFTVSHHFFLPGFPEMAWPMADWVLDHYYAETRGERMVEASLQIIDTPESALVPVMEAFSGRYPGLKLYSLPRMGQRSGIELGLRGHGEIESALKALKEALEKAGIPHRESMGQ